MKSQDEIIKYLAQTRALHAELCAVDTYAHTSILGQLISTRVRTLEWVLNEVPV